MKRLFLTASSIILVSLCWNVLSWAQDLSGPKLVFKEREFHLQEVMEGTVAEHVFRFFNHGDKPLKILHIKPG